MKQISRLELLFQSGLFLNGRYRAQWSAVVCSSRVEMRGWVEPRPLAYLIDKVHPEKDDGGGCAGASWPPALQPSLYNIGRLRHPDDA